MASPSTKPTAFGSYLLDRKLAEGGMAEVFLARQQGLGGFEKQVVVKRILPALSTHTDFVQMFLNEARLAARLSHSNVVQVIEAGEIDGRYYIAMEYIEGSDLKVFYDRAEATGIPTPPGVACRIVADLLAGLHYAHTRINEKGQPLGIVHRDVSPQNVLVTRSGNVKVVDFGIAKATRIASNNTQIGQVKGKIAYMSPEQAMGRPVDARSDVFACGILLWELCSGARLFSRPNDMAAILAITEDDVPTVRSVRSELPEGLERILGRALARKAADRYADAQSMEDELETLIRQQNWAGDRRTLERHMQTLLPSSTPLFGERAIAAAAGDAFSDGPTVLGSELGQIGSPVNPQPELIGGAATLAMEPVSAPQPTPGRARTPSGMRSMPPGAQSSPTAGQAPPPPAPALEAPHPTPGRARTPSGMRSMPPLGAPSPQSGPQSGHSGNLPAQASNFDGPTVPSTRTGRRVLVVLSAAVLVSAIAIFAIEWSSHRGKPTESAISPNAALLLVEVSEPATIEVDGKRTRIEARGEVELAANRQANFVATTIKAPPVTRTIALPPAKPGERMPLKITFTR